jgi:RNA polymerase primary sigma factor
LDLKALLAVLYRNLQQAAHHGVIPIATFEAETSGLPLDDPSRARLLAEPARMGLRVQPPVVRLSTTSDIRDVKKVVRPHTEITQAEHIIRPRTRAALDALGRYAEDGAVTGQAVSGVARLAGLTPSEADALKRSAEADYHLVTAERALAEPAPGQVGTEPSLSAPSAPDFSPGDGALADALSAAFAAMDEDRFAKRPGKRILSAHDQVRTWRTEVGELVQALAP